MNYYSAVKYIADQLRAAGFNTVTFGEIDEVDLQRESIFPLAHIVPESCGIAQQPFTYTFTIIALDTVFFPKGDIKNEIEPFFGMDNTQDVLADIHFRLANFGEYIKRGAGEFVLQSDGLDIDPFKERWESLVSGWVMGITIGGKNYGSIC
jgi:hypothetical protein